MLHTYYVLASVSGFGGSSSEEIDQKNKNKQETHKLKNNNKKNPALLELTLQSIHISDSIKAAYKYKKIRTDSIAEK